VRATIQAACRALLRRNQHPVPGPEQLFRDLPQALRHPCDMVHGRHPRHHQNLPATATSLTPAGVCAGARRPAAAGLAARIHRIVGRRLRCHGGDTGGDIDARRAYFCVADRCRGTRAAGPSADRCPVCSTRMAQRGTSRNATLERAPAHKGARACRAKSTAHFAKPLGGAPATREASPGRRHARPRRAGSARLAQGRTKDLGPARRRV